MKKNCLLLLFVALFAACAFAQKPNNFADDFLYNTAKSHELTQADLSDHIISHQHVSSTSGVHHFYYRQRYQGIEVHGANASIHILPSGKLLRAHNDFVPELASKIVGTNEPGISAQEAILAVAEQMQYTLSAPLEILNDNGGADRQLKFTNAGISHEDIPVKLMYQPLSDGTLKLVWNLSIDATAEPNWWEFRVDAATGEILDKTNWTVHCNLEEAHKHTNACNHASDLVCIDEEIIAETPVVVGAYNVYAMPVESPNFGGRTSVADPDNAIASPFGWHDTDGVAGAEYTITRGNNVHAYEDGDNPGFSPDGGAGLSFDFPINTTYSQADQSESAAITNLFYWSNLCHDLWYLYGFDEASGNFQQNNYGNGGIAGDDCRSEAQDGSGTCNANMSTPTDGSRPRMQMYVCNSRDGDLDNGVIVHEYGHGISIRLTGGAGNSGCLNNQEQMGEGWSDYFGMVMSIEAGDAGPDSRGMGTWLFGQGPNGGGIRPHPYSTDFAINPHTYDDIKTEVAPHGVGSVWCAMLWEMTWDLIGVHGFDPDFYNGDGGNNIAMALVTEGLKLQPCSPGFVDGRDAILDADEALYGGANSCLIWEAFARRGLGVNALQGSTANKGDGTEDFDVPASCIGASLAFTVSTINTTEGAEGELPSAPGECRPYNEFEIGVSLSQDPDPALDPADVSIVEVGANTTADANDYELIGADMIFTEAGIQTATLIIYNDALIEDLEDIEFELVLNNPGDTDAFIGGASISKVKVGNDDFAPEDQVAVSNILTTSFEADMEGFTSTNETSGEGPTSIFAQGDADDATSTYWTVPVPLDGSTGMVYANDDDCNCIMEDVRFISPVYDFSNYTTVELRYDIFFEGRTYQGNTETADLMISVNGGTSFTSIGDIDGVSGNWREDLVDLSAYAGLSDVQIAFRYSDATGWLYGIAIDHVRIDGTVLSPPPVATTLGFISEQEVLADQDIYFYNEDGSILALLENGPQDLGCVEVTIDRAGTGATEFWDNLPEHYLLDKTYLFTPEFNGPNYSYTVTLYYDADEVAGWELATGNEWEQAMLIKHPTAISDVTPATPDGTGPIEQVVDAAGNLAYAPDDYFITATFNTGFSGMGVGLPGTEALPVELISFDGVHIKEVANYLSWQTASEVDNDRFELERSFDGRDFEMIATIEGFGTSNELNNYEFYDRDYKVGEHYYRLKQVDVDGRFEYSQIVVLDVNAGDNKVTVFPNPAQDDISVSFANDVNGDFVLTVFSASGKKLMEQQISMSAERTFNLNIEDLPKGVYYAELVDELNNVSQQFKFVKE